MFLLAEEMQRVPEANALLIAFIVNKTLDANINAQIKKMYDAYRIFIESVFVSVGVEVREGGFECIACVCRRRFFTVVSSTRGN